MTRLDHAAKAAKAVLDTACRGVKMLNNTNIIIEKVRSLPLDFRRRFASHKSKAINRKQMSEEEAIFYAWQRLGIKELDVFQTNEKKSPKNNYKSSVFSSWLSRWVKGDLS